MTKVRFQLKIDYEIMLSRRNQQYNALFYHFCSWSRFAMKLSKKKQNLYYLTYLHSGIEEEQNKKPRCFLSSFQNISSEIRYLRINS